jgi:hypothetical protein
MVVRTCSTYWGEERNIILARKPQGKRELEILRHRWEDNIKMDLREARCKGVD